MSKTQRNAVVLLIPGVVFYTVALDLHPEISIAFALQIYGVVIYICCYIVLVVEYTRYFDLHKRKDLALDTLILLAVSLGARYFITNTKDLPRALWGTDVSLLSACVWQVYTMKLNNYFGTHDKSWTSWLRLLAEPLFPFRAAPPETLHRDEYRYWLLVDGAQVLILTSVLVLYPSFLRTMSDYLILLFIVIFILGQLINVFRYRRVVAARETAKTHSPLA
jgi:hypothetical protein